MCFSPYKNYRLIVKLWWVGARDRKKRKFFVPLILSKENFFNICVLSQCLVYWMPFQNTHTFAYQDTLLHTLYLYFLPDFSKHPLSNYFSLKFEDIKDCLWVLNFQILFMLINPRTSFIFVGPMFWIRKVFSCLYRIEEIIPYFCSYVGDNFYV